MMMASGGQAGRRAAYNGDAAGRKMRQEGEKEGSKRPNGADSQTVREGNTRDSQSPGLPNMDRVEFSDGFIPWPFSRKYTTNTRQTV